MVYERVKKNSSSWNSPVSKEFQKNQFQPRSFVVPSQQNQNSSPPPKLQAPVNVQTQTTAERQTSELESLEQENKLNKDALGLQEQGESGNDDTDLSANGGTIQRLSSKFSTEQQEGIRTKELTLPLQTKFTISAQRDKYKQEAPFDLIEEQPLVQSIHPLIHRQRDLNISRQPITSISPLIQRQIVVNCKSHSKTTNPIHQSTDSTPSAKGR